MPAVAAWTVSAQRIDLPADLGDRALDVNLEAAVESLASRGLARNLECDLGLERGSGAWNGSARRWALTDSDDRCRARCWCSAARANA